MITFNSDNIVVGQIKQILSSHNLPKFRVYTESDRRFFEEHGYESPNIIPTITYSQSHPEFNNHERHVHYIKDNSIQEFVYQDIVGGQGKKHIVGTWKMLNEYNSYFENKFMLNSTKTLPIKNNIYDYETHEYLGEYLRFKRDFCGIDLMSMYNCFSNRVCTNLYINVETDNLSFTFNTLDPNYRYYIVPVKLFKNYTIAIDSGLPIEMCCCVFGKYQDTRDKFSFLPKCTYKKYNTMRFNSPVIFDKLSWSSLITMDKKLYESEIVQNECDLKLVLKVPFSVRSSIVILEGEYIKDNDSTVVTQSQTLSWLGIEHNKTTLNFEKLPEDLKLISKNKLLKLNSGISYPLSDRLVEYLTDNVISNQETIAKNLIKTKVICNAIRLDKNKDIRFNELIQENGLWDDKIKYIVYSYMSKSNSVKIKNSFEDTLGYIDKSVEKYFNSKDGSLLD